MILPTFSPFPRRVLLTLAAAFVFPVGPAMADEPPKASAPDTPKQTDWQVLPLKNANAVETERLLHETLGREAHVLADPRTNSLLILALPGDMPKIREIISKVDVPAKEDNAPQRLEVFTLKSVEPDQVLQEALRLVVRPGGGKSNFTLDPRRKQVILWADPATTVLVQSLLNRLEGQSRSDMDVRVRVVWLVNGLARDDAPQPPEDLKEVLPDLAKLGIDRPRLVAQTMVNVTPNMQFQTKGVAKLDFPCQFSVTGRYNDKSASPALQITIRALRMDQEEICNLQTEISAPLGHLVVLGVTPTEAASSVFVVQVLRKDAKPGKTR